MTVPKSIMLPQNLILHNILYLNQNREKEREREITSGGALQVMPSDGFQFQQLEWNAYLLHISAWLQDRFCRKRLQNFMDHSHYRNTQKEKIYIYTHIQKLKRSKNSKTFVDESELVAIDQSEVILRKIYSISLQTTHSPQTCMHSFLTKVQCSTLKIKEWPSKFQYSTTYQNILSNMPIAQPLLLA